MSNRSTYSRAMAVALFVGLWSAESSAQDLRPMQGPFGGPVADPFGNGMGWSPMGNNRNAFLFYLAAQHRGAQRSAAQEAEAKRIASTPAPLVQYQSRPGGTAASKYFNRTTATPPTAGSAPVSHYGRYKHYFGNRGG